MRVTKRQIAAVLQETSVYRAHFNQGEDRYKRLDNVSSGDKQKVESSGLMSRSV
jgi:hypothetical protein